MPTPTSTIYITKPTIPLLYSTDYQNNIAAPLPASQGAQDGVGVSSTIDTLSTLSQVGGALTPSAQTTAASDPRQISQTFPRVPGRGVHIRLKQEPAFGGAGQSTIHGLSADPSIGPTLGVILNSTGGINYYPPNQGGLYTVTPGTYFDLHCIDGDSPNSYIFINGRLAWIDRGQMTGNNRTLLAIFANVAARRSAAIEFALARDYGPTFRDLAGLRYSPTGQAEGPELMANGTFTNWTGSVPNSWTVSAGGGPGDPELTQVAPANLHGGGGTGAANFFASATANQPVMHQNSLITNNVIYLDEFSISAIAAGNFLARCDNPGTTPTIYQTSSVAAGIRRSIYRGSTNTRIRIQAINLTATDLTIDYYSHKALTLNTAQVMPSSDCWIDVDFTAPGAPVRGDTLILCYRIVAPGDELFNCDTLVVRWNEAASAWELGVIRYIAGTPTTQFSFVSIGTNVTGIRVAVASTLHTIYSAITTSIVLRNSGAFGSALNTATGLNVISTPGFSNINVTCWAVDDLDRKQRLFRRRIA